MGEIDELAGSRPLGEVIRRRRAELGWTQRELAARIGGGGDAPTQSDVSRLERGAVGLPRRARLERIAAALGLPLGELLARSGWAQAADALRAADGAAGPVGPSDVLVVDDEPVVAEALAALLEDEGYRVRCAHDGLAALAEVERRAPGLVVADAMLPRLDGADLARRLRARPDPVPVVLVSGRPADPGVPGVPFLAKPLDLGAFLGAVAGALAPRGGAPEDRPAP